MDIQFLNMKVRKPEDHRKKEMLCDNLFGTNDCTGLCKIIMLTSTLAFLPHKIFLNSLLSNSELKLLVSAKVCSKDSIAGKIAVVKIP